MARVAGPRGVLVALAVVAGLFAMHGLTQHGDHLATATATTHAAHGLHATDTAAPDPAPADDPAGPGALALCLTVLAAAWLAVWATARPRGGVLRTLVPVVTAAPRPPVRARAPDPPDRWALSVCRC